MRKGAIYTLLKTIADKVMSLSKKVYRQSYYNHEETAYLNNSKDAFDLECRMRQIEFDRVRERFASY